MFQCPTVDTDQYLAVRMHEAFGLPIVSREKVETPSSQWNFFAFSITLYVFTASNNIPVVVGRVDMRWNRGEQKSRCRGRVDCVTGRSNIHVQLQLTSQTLYYHTTTQQYQFDFQDG